MDYSKKTKKKSALFSDDDEKYSLKNQKKKEIKINEEEDDEITKQKKILSEKYKNMKVVDDFDDKERNKNTVLVNEINFSNEELFKRLGVQNQVEKEKIEKKTRSLDEIKNDLRRAIFLGLLDEIKLIIIEDEYDINKEDKEFGLEFKGKYYKHFYYYSDGSETFLYQGNKKELDKLYGIDKKHGDFILWSPFHFACFIGSLDTVKFLIENKADINKTDSAGKHPLEIIKKRPDMSNNKDFIKLFD
jgi:hypothetical protein